MRCHITRTCTQHAPPQLLSASRTALRPLEQHNHSDHNDSTYNHINERDEWTGSEELLLRAMNHGLSSAVVTPSWPQVPESEKSDGQLHLASRQNLRSSDNPYASHRNHNYDA